MRSLLAQLRAFWRGVQRPSQLDSEMNDEMRFHLEMETQRLQQRGLSAGEAARQAAVAFGGVEKYRGAGRDALGLTWTRGLSTDLKLGTRMLRKFPGLTAVALFALSLAIGAGAAYLEFVNDLLHGRLPFADADRIVGIQMWDQQTGNPEHRVTAEFASWRSSLRSFEALAAYRRIERTLITPDGHAEPVRAVEITPSAFHIARVPPLLGRPLADDDARPGAPLVVAIGYDLWTARFGSDPAAVGQTVRIGQDRYTVVGVMPQGFGLPTNQSMWMPLYVSETTAARREGPPTRIFGKLAPGMAIGAAQAELDAVAARAAGDFPATHRYLNPVVKPYVESLWSAVEDSTMQTAVLYAANVFFIGLLALCGANIATLVFARTATRETEISVRTALGASRARIAGQLFAEALVLSALAAGIGLTVGAYALQWVKSVVSAGMGPIMFWWNDRLAPATILYAALLAVLAAIIIGVVPALKATGPRVQERLKQSTGATSSGLKFGGVWTGVIVTQVAVTVVFLAIVGILGWSAYVTGGGKRRQNFPADQYVAARLILDRTADRPAGSTPEELADDQRQLRSTYAELSRRLEGDPAILGVTYGKRLPGMNAEFLQMDVNDLPPPSGQKAHDIRTTTVAPNYFETFNAPIISGRAFSMGDLAPGRNVAIVDRTFVTRVFNGRDAVGRQVRLAAGEAVGAGPWIEIVGVVADLTDDTNKKPGEAMLYFTAAPETLRPFYVGVRARTTTAAAMSRLRIIAGEVDPTLRLSEVVPLDQISEYDRVALDFFARLMGGISIVALILATAGVYALMAFTVSRRTAEIGIRVALGANPGRIVMATFSRAFSKIVIGLLAGAVPAAAIAVALGPEVSPSSGASVTMATCLFATLTVAAVTMVACVVPARRALRIQPADALKAE
jgi:predicted permease